MTKTVAEYEGMRTHLRLALAVIESRAAEEGQNPVWITMMYGSAIKAACKGWTSREMADLWYLITSDVHRTTVG